ncbi:MAG TPA: M23 family metallopeptidase [Myxococcota bacterium]|jgi:murein DD-endopeptidase MepM/ murein hydrolase activator NlpD
MLRRLLILTLLVVTASCGPALKPLPPMAPLPEPSSESPSPPAPAPTGDRNAVAAPERDAALETLRERGLLVPVKGVVASQIPDTYDAARDGARVHNAQDILAKRGTPVLAADDGTILHIGQNTLGGKVIWTTDPTRRFAFYYAHLDHYAKGLRDGQQISRGDVLGYVGTTGNAPKDTPHLHFQVVRIVSGKRYSEGPPLNPLPLFTPAGTTR